MEKHKEDVRQIEKKDERGGGGGGDIWSSIKMTIVLVTSTSIVLLALRNTITYHLQHFWGASGNFWQNQWDKILDFNGHNQFNLLVYGPTFSGYMIYWVTGGIYTLMDLTNKPAFLRPYKVQPGTNEPVSPRQVFKCFLVVTFNQLVVGLSLSILCYHLFIIRGYDQSPQLPTFHWVLLELAVCVLLEEVGFYYSHRLFHHRYFYKRFHKLHHEWQSPISITALYAHPLEHLLSNMGPVLLGPLVLGSHPATIWLWTTLANLSTINAHSGYHLPFFPSPEFHDFHHLKFNQCFGVLGILDHLHGTDDKFRASKSYMRNVTFLSFVPPRQLIPEREPEEKKDENKKCWAIRATI